MTALKAMIWHVAVTASLAIVLLGHPPGHAQAPSDTDETALIANVPYAPPPIGPRYTAFISDLHFGIGRKADGSWDPKEDFRWPRALEGFLERISEEGHERVDLVIAGDLLELWQPPPEIKCKGQALTSVVPLTRWVRFRGLSRRLTRMH